MIQVELLRGGIFSLNEADVKSAILDETYNGIVIETNSGTKITIKDDEDNRLKWLKC